MLGKAAQVALIYHRRLFRQPKAIFIICALFILVDYQIGGIRRFCAASNVSVSLFGIMAMILASPRSSCLLTLLFAFLLCDLPGWTEFEPYVLQRSGNKAWITGKIIIVISMAVLYLSALLLCVIIVLNKHITFDSGWGKAISTLAQTDSTDTFKIWIEFPRKIMGSYSAVVAFAISFGLFFGMLTCLGIWALCINMITNTPVGSVVMAAFALVAVAIGGLVISGTFYKISPVSLASLDVINPGYISYRPTLSYSISFYAVGIVIGVVLLFFTAERFIEKH